jgi:hypothetical protein
MATTAEKDRPAEGSDHHGSKKQTLARRRWHWWLIASLAVVAAAPMLACKTPLRNVVLATALGKAPMHGQATVGSLSFGWLSPILVTDLELRDDQGQVLANVPELTLSKSLVDLLLDRTDVGRLRLERPSITLRLRDDGSNLEDMFPGFVAKTSIDAGEAVEVVVEHADKSPVAVEIEINDGELTVSDATAGREWKMEQMTLHFNQPTSGATEVSFFAAMPQTSPESHLKLQAGLTSDDGTAKAAATDAIGADFAATFEAVDFPLESLRALVARRAPGVALAGQFDGKCEWSGSLVGDFTITNLLLTSPGLGDDVLKLARVEMPCRLSVQGSQISIQQLALHSDVGQMSCKGSVTLTPGQIVASARSPAGLLQAASGDVSGQIDMAKLARLLPHHTRFRPDAELASAPVNFNVAPRLRRNGDWLLEFGAGRVLDHVHATPALCDAWLKFAIPMLAEVTEVDGEFSVDLEGLQVPLSKPAAGQTAGKIAIHSIELGPGPFVQEFVPVIEKLRGLLGSAGGQPLDRLSIARDSQVEFRLVDGRVYHRGLRLQLPQLTIETHGSVGLDESLAMVAEISLFDKGLLNGPLGELFKSRSLELPIGGTLKKPQLDTRALSGLLPESLRDTAKGLLGDKVERELNRLFKQ